MSVGSAKESGGSMIKSAVIDSVVIHENMVSPRQTPDAHVARLSLILQVLACVKNGSTTARSRLTQLVFRTQRY